MAKDTHKADRQILGISLPPEVAKAVKSEATRRDLTLRKLFEEMWTLYLESKKHTDNGR